MARLEIWWLIWSFGGSLGDLMPHLGLWWLVSRFKGSFGGEIAQFEMWWLVERCGGSFGDHMGHRTKRGREGERERGGVKREKEGYT